VPASEAAYEFAVVCEARADQLTACGLADRVLLKSVDWLETELLDSSRRWRGETPVEEFLKWARVKDRAAERGIKIFGRFDDKPDALSARKALLLLSDLEPRPAAVLLIRDSDGYPDRKGGQGLKQARDAAPWPFQVIVGVAHPKREAWVLAGFQPWNPEESSRLQSLQERLSMDPIRRSHELAAREHGAKTDIKRALGELIPDGDEERERRCLQETELEVLEQRGKDNGLAAYLEEVRQRLVPVLSGRAPET
jgi:hypothetical protein